MQNRRKQFEPTRLNNLSDLIDLVKGQSSNAYTQQDLLANNDTIKRTLKTKKQRPVVLRFHYKTSSPFVGI